jgi:hypothetical protein
MCTIKMTLYKSGCKMKFLKKTKGMGGIVGREGYDRQNARTASVRERSAVETENAALKSASGAPGCKQWTYWLKCRVKND